MEKSSGDRNMQGATRILSHCTYNQLTVLTRMRWEIENRLEEAATNSTIHQESERVHGLFWIWVLGTYELTRTMHGVRERLPQPTRKKVAAFKAKLKLMRDALYRQPHAAQHRGCHGEVVISDLDADKNDFYLLHNGEKHWARTFLGEYQKIVEEICIADLAAACSHDCQQK